MDRWMNTLRIAIEQTHTQRVFQTGDGFGYDGIGNG